jgi:hypothetical protein
MGIPYSFASSVSHDDGLTSPRERTVGGESALSLLLGRKAVLVAKFALRRLECAVASASDGRGADSFGMGLGRPESCRQMVGLAPTPQGGA